jgi:DNA polymerase
MSRDAALREALRARLEWLRLLGVSDLSRPKGAMAPTAAAPRAMAPPVQAADEVERPAAGQHGLFVAAQPEAEAPAGGRVTGSAPRGGAAASPLLAAVATEGIDAATWLRAIRDDLGDCRRCRLCERRTQVVFGVGDPGARLMFIGEGPGADEDAQGEPFVGRAGQLLTKMIEAMGLTRSQVYIANIVKCRPPENRTPLPDEVATCSPFLLRQIAAIRPKVIVCLGTPSAQAILGTRETITRLRGTFRDVGGYRVMPTFHPAYLLRNPPAKREVWDDLKQVMAVLAGA